MDGIKCADPEDRDAEISRINARGGKARSKFQYDDLTRSDGTPGWDTFWLVWEEGDVDKPNAS